MRKLALVAAAAPLAVVTAAPANAAAGGPDFSTLTGAIDFSTTSEAVLSVGVLAIGLTLVVLGIRKVMAMIRSA